MASRTLSGPLTGNATLLDGPVANSVRELKEQHHGKLVVTGAGTLARSLVAEGLVDTTRFAAGDVRLCCRPTTEDGPSQG